MTDKFSYSTEYVQTWWESMGCIRNPGYSTGEQCAMQNEIDQLRKLANDLEDLLRDAEADNDNL